MASSQHPRDRSFFQIAIICALQVEHDAVEALLDDDYESDGFSYGKAKGDQNAYTLGRIGNHHVVLAYMPDMGKANAASVAAGIRSSFESVKLALVVGVCGAAPRTDDGTTIFLGDVVISTTVLQHDFGRLNPDGPRMKDTLEGNLGLPSLGIRSFLKKAAGLRSRQRLREKTSRYCNQVCQEPDFQASVYPGLENDLLYAPDYRHKHQRSGSCSTCNACQTLEDKVCETALIAPCLELSCDSGRLITRARLQPGNAIHFGRVASGDMVIKNGLYRDQLIHEYRVLAFEMESAGAWNNLPTVVIKAASDYADSHKSQRWQKYAAVVSAACAKALLEEWRTSEMLSETGAEKEVREKEAREKEAREKEAREKEAREKEAREKEAKEKKAKEKKTKEKEAKEERRRCLHSLSFGEIDAREANISSAHRNTCNWLFKAREFRRWQARENSAQTNGVLWIKGKPGAGKSTLMKHALRYHQKSSQNCSEVAYFFNARGHILEKTSLGMFRSLLYQMLKMDSTLCDEFLLYYRGKQHKHSGSWQWHLRELRAFLLDMARENRIRPTCIFIDALDECDDHEVRDVVSILEELSEMATNSGCQISICLSSRHYPHITMKKRADLVVEKQPGHVQDIITYIKDKLIAKEQDIEQELIQKANGVFMWVILVIELLNQAYDEGMVIKMKTKLIEIPDDLDEVFRMVLEKNNRHKAEMVLLLQWVLFSRRPLKLEELYLAVLAGTHSDEPTTWNRSRTGHDVLTRYIITISRGLVECRRIARDIYEVQFIHETVKHFLLRDKRLQVLDPTLAPDILGASHDRLLKSCVSYLGVNMEDVLGKCFTEPGSAADYFRLNYPLLIYATTHVITHLEQAQLGGLPAQPRLHQLWKNRTAFGSWKWSHDQLVSWESNQYGLEADMLYILAVHGNPLLVKAHLCEPGIDINALGGNHGTALHGAIYSNHVHVVQALVDAGARVDTEIGKTWLTALQLANSSRNSKIRNILHNAGGNINVQMRVSDGTLEHAEPKRKREWSPELRQSAHMYEPTASRAVAGGRVSRQLESSATRFTVQKNKRVCRRS